YTRAHVLQEFQVPPERVVAIPRGVDLDAFDPDKVPPEKIAAARAQLGLSSDDPRLVVILPARLKRWKGQLVLIETSARIAQTRPGALKLVFAGDDQGRSGYLREMERAIADGGLQENVVIAGHIRQIVEALAASDVAAFPSTDPEAFGRGAIEA